MLSGLVASTSSKFCSGTACSSGGESVAIILPIYTLILYKKFNLNYFLNLYSIV